MAVGLGAEKPKISLWTELKARRDALPGAHQEFEVSQTFKTSHGNQAMKRQLIVDMSGARWRESSISGSGTHVRIFDGTDLFSMEEGGDEYIRVKRRAKDEDPAPFPYGAADADWAKAAEVERVSLVFAGFHQDNPSLLAFSLENMSDAMGVAFGGVLGMPVLGQLKLTIDYDEGAVRFEYKK